MTYTITANDGTTDWRSHIEKVTQWEPWIYSEKELEQTKKKEKPLPQVELGRFYYQPSWVENLRIPVVVKRTWKEALTKTEEKYGYDLKHFPCQKLLANKAFAQLGMRPSKLRVN